ncbi:DUF397 domain-containing protein [Streptomyces sp. TM32]|uniref:DUF397 domain-containing protein n=1 Tax=Streptomyces sp. TM32 TaxID=1652669 RepID=UPI001013696A|nr:DUF397 domain-containing protein [Streptomyces sp. TM32]RXS68352.1 DUF397 domain-containing protein [Streptomyces sp. TM32]
MTEQRILDASALTGWRKSSYSNNEGGSCLEVLDSYHSSGIPVRDSKVPHGPALLFSADSWIPFVSALKNGELPSAAR